MPGVTCSGTSISFSTQNNFKQSDQYRGKYDLVDADSGDALASGDFYWAAYWRETSVEISLDSQGEAASRLMYMKKALSPASKFDPSSGAEPEQKKQKGSPSGAEKSE